MKKIKNLICLVIVFVILSYTLSVNSVSVIGTFEVDMIGNSKYSGGDEFEIRIYVKNMSNINGLANGICVLIADVIYDENILEAIGGEGKNGFELTWGTTLVLDNKDGVNSETELAVLRFKVKDGIEAETTQIILSDITASNGKDNIPTNNVTKTIYIYGEDEEIDIELDSSIYIIKTEEDINYLTKVPANTTVEDIKENVTVNSYNVYFKFYNYLGEELEDGDRIGTGGKIILFNENDEIVNEYFVIVKGDLDGDGRVTATDLAKIRRHLAEIETLNGMFFKAALITEKEGVTVTDLAKVRRHLADLENLYN